MVDEELRGSCGSVQLAQHACSKHLMTFRAECFSLTPLSQGLKRMSDFRPTGWLSTDCPMRRA